VCGGGGGGGGGGELSNEEIHRKRHLDEKNYLHRQA
jgi:hypothetical protein